MYTVDCVLVCPSTTAYACTILTRARSLQQHQHNEAAPAVAKQRQGANRISMPCYLLLRRHENGRRATHAQHRHIFWTPTPRPCAHGPTADELCSIYTGDESLAPAPRWGTTSSGVMKYGVLEISKYPPPPPLSLFGFRVSICKWYACVDFRQVCIFDRFLPLCLFVWFCHPGFPLVSRCVPRRTSERSSKISPHSPRPPTPPRTHPAAQRHSRTLQTQDGKLPRTSCHDCTAAAGAGLGTAGGELSMESAAERSKIDMPGAPKCSECVVVSTGSSFKFYGYVRENRNRSCVDRFDVECFFSGLVRRRKEGGYKILLLIVPSLCLCSE